LAEKLKKIEEAAKKRAEDETSFIQSTKESLEQKMEAFIENRENIITDLKSKLSNHVSSVRASDLE
jgi:flagellar biosynthesis chaperone FliJ